VASSSSERLFDWPDIATTVSPFISQMAWFFRHLVPETFLAGVVWMFFRDFPRALVSEKQRRFANRMIYAAFSLGALLFILYAVPLALGDRVQLNTLVARISGSTQLGILDRYVWAAIVLLILPSLPFAVLKTRMADLQERRRVILFLGGLIVGCGPILLAVLAKGALPEFARFMNEPSNRWVENFVLRPLLVSVPITTACAVLVYHVMDVRLVLRAAIRYTFARTTVYAVAIAPFAAIAWYLYNHRGETVSGLFAGSRPLWFVLAAIGAITAVRLRDRALNSLDQRFFREQYDSEKILMELVERSRKAESIHELTELLGNEIDRALHLRSISVLISNRSLGILESPARLVRPLRMSSMLALMAGGQPEPMGVNLDDPDSALRRLAETEREWIADGAFRLLVPLLATDGTLIGLVALGEKKSELPFSREDRMLLTAIAGSAALTIENRLISSGGPGDTTAGVIHRNHAIEYETDAALECENCHRIQPQGEAICQCGGRLAVAPVPYVLLGKFRFEQRLGKGGMGVVYKAHDINLNRTVAIKTLPRVTPEYSSRLRHEARAMAAVLHPNLAQIFGAETWHGIPLLIVEFLSGGTLAERLKRARLPLKETLELGITLAKVLESMHSVGILHRDIKPSNIGYTSDGTPKLLDLGLAKIVLDSWTSGAITTADEVKSSADTQNGIQDLRSLTLPNQLVGTPAYLSPEAVAGKPPSSALDLWSLTVVLFEVMAGKHPMLGSNAQETLHRIRNGQAYDIREFSPDCTPEIAEFFANALSQNHRERPQSAAAFHDRLKCILDQVGPTKW